MVIPGFSAEESLSETREFYRSIRKKILTDHSIIPSQQPTSQHDRGRQDGSLAPGTSCPWHINNRAYCEGYNEGAGTVHCGAGFQYDCYTVGTNDGSRDGWDSSVTCNNQFRNHIPNCLSKHSQDYCTGYNEGYGDALNDRCG
jgi:hypothetical protein